MFNKKQEQTISDGGIGFQAARDINLHQGVTKEELEQTIQRTLKIVLESKSEEIRNLKEDKLRLQQQLEDTIRSLTYKTKDLNESQEVRDKFESALNLIRKGDSIEAENLFLQIENRELEKIEKSNAKIIEAAFHRGTLASVRSTEDAISAFERILKVDSEHLEAKSKLAYLYMRSNQLKNSELLFKQNLKTAKEQKNDHCEAATFTGLGQTYFCMGDLNRSAANQHKALLIWKKLGDITGCIGSYTELANTSFSLREFSRAKTYIELAEKLADDSIGDDSTAIVYSTKGVIYSSLGELDVAKPAFLKALEYAEKTDEAALRSTTYGNLAILYKQLQEYDESEKMFKLSLSIDRELGHAKGIATSLINLANLYSRMNNMELALEYALEAVQVSTNLINIEALSAAYSALGSIYQEQGSLELALESFTEVLEIERSRGSLFGQAEALFSTSNVLLTLNEKRKARANLKEASRILKNTDEIELRKKIKRALKKL